MAPSTDSEDSPLVTARRFAELGGAFLTEPDVLAGRLAGIRGLVFDWDGVFNKGAKGPGAASTFSEADSMGTNMLRFALWRPQQTLPTTAIITGAENPGAELFANREHFHALYQGVRNKADAIDRLCADYRVEKSELICVFDDINDLAMAADCGVRVLVRRHSSPLLQEYVTKNGLCDYITAAGSDGYAVREVTEMLLGLMGAFESVVHSRTAADDHYAAYFSARQAVETQNKS